MVNVNNIGSDCWNVGNVVGAVGCGKNENVSEICKNWYDIDDLSCIGNVSEVESDIILVLFNIKS